MTRKKCIFDKMMKTISYKVDILHPLPSNHHNNKLFQWNEMSYTKRKIMLMAFTRVLYQSHCQYNFCHTHEPNGLYWNEFRLLHHTLTEWISKNRCPLLALYGGYHIYIHHCVDHFGGFWYKASINHIIFHICNNDSWHFWHTKSITERLERTHNSNKYQRSLCPS